MKQIKEDYCSYEIAKLLKEKGFDEPQHFYYYESELFYSSLDTYDNKNKELEAICPTHQLAMKWLREKHKLFIDVSFTKDESDGVIWFYIIFSLGKKIKEYSKMDYSTYEQAVEAALKYCLTELI